VGQAERAIYKKDSRGRIYGEITVEASDSCVLQRESQSRVKRPEEERQQWFSTARADSFQERAVENKIRKHFRGLPAEDLKRSALFKR